MRVDFAFFQDFDFDQNHFHFVSMLKKFEMCFQNFHFLEKLHNLKKQKRKKHIQIFDNEFLQQIIEKEFFSKELENLTSLLRLIRKYKDIEFIGNTFRLSKTPLEVFKDKEVIKFVESCPIPPVIINTINAAAKNQPIQLKMSPEMEVKK